MNKTFSINFIRIFLSINVLFVHVFLYSIMGNFSSVRPFIFISGFLNAFSVSKIKNLNTTTTLEYVIKRYVRILLPLFLILLIVIGPLNIVNNAIRLGNLQNLLWDILKSLWFSICWVGTFFAAILRLVPFIGEDIFKWVINNTQTFYHYKFENLVLPFTPQWSHMHKQGFMYVSHLNTVMYEDILFMLTPLLSILFIKNKKRIWNYFLIITVVTLSIVCLFLLKSVKPDTTLEMIASLSEKNYFLKIILPSFWFYLGGMLLFHIYEKIINSKAKQKIVDQISKFFLISLILIIPFIYFYSSDWTLITQNNQFLNLLRVYLQIIIIGWFVIGLLMLENKYEKIHLIAKHKFVKRLSYMTYSIYIIHLFIVSIVFTYTNPYTPQFKQWWLQILIIIATFILAFLSSKFIEEPVLKNRDKIVKKLMNKKT